MPATRYIKFIVLVTFCATLLALSLPAAASPITALGSFGNWQAYPVTENKEQVCYMTLVNHFPAIKKGKRKSGRNDARLTITHRPAEATLDVVSYDAGYNFKSPSDAKIRIGKDDFDLFTQQTTAWTRDAHTDHLLAADIRKQTMMIVSGTPSKGSPVADKIDLTGADLAYQAIGKSCGVEKTTAKTAVKIPIKKTPAKKVAAKKTVKKTPAKKIIAKKKKKKKPVAKTAPTTSSPSTSTTGATQN